MIKRRNFITGLTVALLVPLPLRAAEADATDSPITDEDRRILRRQDHETLAEWHCILNGWGWPKLLPNPEPPTYIDGGRRGRIMEWISGRIGFDACLWKHNQSVMSREQFDDWRRMDRDEYGRKYPFNSENSNLKRQKRAAHKRAMYARHGAEHLEYIES